MCGTLSNAAAAATWRTSPWCRLRTTRPASILTLPTTASPGAFAALCASTRVAWPCASLSTCCGTASHATTKKSAAAFRVASSLRERPGPAPAAFVATLAASPTSYLSDDHAWEHAARSEPTLLPHKTTPSQNPNFQPRAILVIDVDAL